MFSSSSNRKLTATYLAKVFGVDSIGKFQVSDFDGFMDGRKWGIEWVYGDYNGFFLLFGFNLGLST